MKALNLIRLASFISFLVSDGMAAIKMFEVSIPKHTNLGADTELSCKFDVTRGKLYSVKWYKDDFEFFRFMPDNRPQIQTFSIPGVTLDISKSNISTVTVRKANFASSGTYRCEVSKDGPNFETVVRTGNLTVMVYPEEDPVITGIHRRYSLGEFVTGNCTSSWSNPAAELSWYINGQQADSWFLEKYPPVSKPKGSLEDVTVYSQSLGLRFLVDKSHFRQGEKLELMCVARIDDLPIRQTLLEISSDEAFMDDIQAQNRLNSSGISSMSKMTMALVVLTALYFIEG